MYAIRSYYGIGSKKSIFIVKGVYKTDKSIMDIFSGEGIVDYKVYKNRNNFV